MHVHDFRYTGLRKGFIFTALFLVTRLAKLSTGLVIGIAGSQVLLLLCVGVH